MIASSTPSAQVHVRARTNYMVNNNTVAGQIAGIAGRRNTNINIRDNRSSLNPYEIANKLV